MKCLHLLLLNILLFPVTSIAHGPTPQKGLESITINAPVVAVWDVIKQFDAIASWHPDVKAGSGDGKNASDGIRTITLKNEGQLVESLDYYSDKDHEYNYRLKTENVTAFPVSSYTTNIQVKAGSDANTSVVTFKSRFYRGDTGNAAPDNLNDAAAVKAMDNFFRNGLAGLKQKLEK
ncbi:MAG: SRPBCC family protein [Methylococcaceae bacterium]